MHAYHKVARFRGNIYTLGGKIQYRNFWVHLNLIIFETEYCLYSIYVEVSEIYGSSLFEL